MPNSSGLLCQAGLLLVELQARYRLSERHVVRFVSCCDPHLAGLVAHAFSQATAIYYGATLHVASCLRSENVEVGVVQHKDAHQRCSHLDLIGPDLETKALYHASFSGLTKFDVDDSAFDTDNDFGISLNAFPSITIDQTAQLTYNRLLQSSIRKEVCIVVTVAGETPIRDIARCVQLMSIFGSEDLAFVFLKSVH